MAGFGCGGEGDGRNWSVITSWPTAPCVDSRVRIRATASLETYRNRPASWMASPQRRQEVREKRDKTAGGGERWWCEGFLSVSWFGRETVDER